MDVGPDSQRRNLVPQDQWWQGFGCRAGINCLNHRNGSGLERSSSTADSWCLWSNGAELRVWITSIQEACPLLDVPILIKTNLLRNQNQNYYKQLKSIIFLPTNYFNFICRGGPVWYGVGLLSQWSFGSRGFKSRPRRLKIRRIFNASKLKILRALKKFFFWRLKIKNFESVHN